MGPTERPLIARKRVGEVLHQDEPPAIRQRIDEGITSQQSGSLDFMNSVARFLEFLHHDFHELVNFRLSEFGTLVKKIYDFDLKNLCQKTQSKETESSTS